MDKPKRQVRRNLRWNIILLALMMTGTTLVMAGSIIFSGLAMMENQRLDRKLNDYRATQDALPHPTQIVRELMVIITATPSPTEPAFLPTAISAGPGTPVYPLCDVVNRFTSYCRGLTVLDRTIEINGGVSYTRFVGISPRDTLISGDNKLDKLIIVRSGSKLRLENISIVNSAWLGIFVEQGAVLELENCEFFGHGSQRHPAAEASNYYGAAIWNEGSLTVNHCIFDHNYTPGGGAVLYNSANGVATLRNSYIRNSTADINLDVAGAAIRNSGTLIIENSEFMGNKAINGSGGALASLAGSVRLSNVTFESNEAKMAAGAALYNAAGSTMWLDGVRMRFNVARTGAGIYNLGWLEVRDSYIDLNNKNCYNAGTLIDTEGACR